MMKSDRSTKIECQAWHSIFKVPIATLFSFLVKIMKSYERVCQIQNKMGIRTLCWLIVPLAATACGFASTTIDIDGSSTVFPISEAVAEEFGKLVGINARVTVGVSGTGGGFQKFCNSQTDINNASRPIKIIEVNRCENKGVQFIEIPVAMDGVTVTVHPSNNFIKCMTLEELHKLWGPEAEGKITRWNQIRSEWPDQKISLYGPGVDSGTFDYFTQTVNGSAQSSRGDFTASENDNVIVQGISGDRNALGFFGFPFFEENASRIRAIDIDGGAGCVSPTKETINNGTYSPMSRPLFIYVRKDSTAEQDIRELVRFYLSDDGQLLTSEVGYIPFPDSVYNFALTRFENGIIGTLFGGPNPQEGSVEEILSNNQ
jgi:phosphate transport system substrate-binding protein